MDEVAVSLRAAIASLDGRDETDLLTEIGRRAEAMQHLPGVAGEFNAESMSGLETLSLGEDLRTLGLRIARRLEKELHGLICGSGDRDVLDQRALSEALGIGREEVQVVMAVLLVTQFGMAPAIAAVVAVLVVKRVFKPTLSEICKFWPETI